MNSITDINLNAVSAVSVLIIITTLIIAQFVYEYYHDSCDRLSVYEMDVTRSESGRPITEIIVDFYNG